jgi:hypothetical protein
VQGRHRGAAVEKRHVIAGIERLQDARKFALVHGNAMIHAGGGDVVARKLHVIRIAFDRVDGGVRGARRERQSRVAECGAKLQNAPRIGRPGKRRQQWSVRIGKSATAVPRAMGVGGVADFRERIGRRGHWS